MKAEASTMAGLIALLQYTAKLFQEAGAPGLPVEVPYAGRWSAAFGKFYANVADRLMAIVAAQSAPERIDRVADAIVEATAPLIDDSRWLTAPPARRSRPSYHEPHAGRPPGRA
jgi:hypothetical protein